MFNESEVSFRNKIERLENELVTEKESNSKLSKDLGEKTYLIRRLEVSVSVFDLSNV